MWKPNRGGSGLIIKHPWFEERRKELERDWELAPGQLHVEKYGKVIVRKKVTYRGGHKAFAPLTVGDRGLLWLTTNHVLFRPGRAFIWDKETLFSLGTKRYKIAIPLDSILVSEWTVGERDTGTYYGLGGTPSGFGGLGGAIITSNTEMEIVLPYVDENGVPQAPRFSRVGRTLTRQIYDQVASVIRAVQATDGTSRSAAGRSREAAVEVEEEDLLKVLKLRLARGEISREEYEETKRIITEP
jgi:hypothetical protein